MGATVLVIWRSRREAKHFPMRVSNKYYSEVFIKERKREREKTKSSWLRWIHLRFEIRVKNSRDLLYSGRKKQWRWKKTSIYLLIDQSRQIWLYFYCYNRITGVYFDLSKLEGENQLFSSFLGRENQEKELRWSSISIDTFSEQIGGVEKAVFPFFLSNERLWKDR